jgi:hypothetical protein
MLLGIPKCIRDFSSKILFRYVVRRMQIVKLMHYSGF